jgi:hypothetical protein
MQRFLIAVGRAVLTDPADDQVHFHQGPQHHPEVCHHAACTRPRLDVETSA